MHQIQQIELNFDVDINNIMIRYSQLRSALTATESDNFRNSVGQDLFVFMVDNLNAELKHIEDILRKVHNEFTAQKASE